MVRPIPARGGPTRDRRSRQNMFPGWLHERYAHDGEDLAYLTMKYAYFCILNHAADVGLDTLMSFVTKYHGGFDSRKVVSSTLYLSLRRACAIFLGRWRVYSDAQWELARFTFKTIFGLELEGGNKYWELIQSL